MSGEEELVYFNGINAETGTYTIDPQPVENIANIARASEKEKNQEDLESRTQLGSFPTMADPKDLSSSGWGVIFASNEDPAVKDALKPLIEHRQKQVNNDDLFKILEFHPGEDKDSFARRYPAIAGFGTVDPESGVPYYLLIVGSPVQIPFSFQYQLDVRYAVGRLCFHTPQEYAYYAQSVVQAETMHERGAFGMNKRISFFGVGNSDDKATQLSTQYLINPLSQKVIEKRASKGWAIDTIMSEQATKEQFHHMIHTPDKRPSFLFTASHGMEFPKGNAKQLRHQGALLCQNWPGPVEWGRKPIPEDFYFSGDDISSDARLLGMIAFFFACFGAGTPQVDDYSHHFRRGASQKAIAEHNFIASLPTHLLANPNGGALAVIGHVERAWGYSFNWPDLDSDITSLDQMMRTLTTGTPIGDAIDHLNFRYASISTALTDKLEREKLGKTVQASEIAGLWVANNDARSYVILGDPAVRLLYAEETNATDIPTLESVSFTPSLSSSTPPLPDGLGTPPLPQPPEKPAGPPDPAAFGILDPWRKDEEGEGTDEKLSSREDLTNKLSDAVSELAQQIKQAFSDAATINVTTCISTTDMASFDDAIPRALTEIAMDGDIKTCIPTKDGEIDHELWGIHTSMVEQARKHRTEMLKLILSAIPGLGNINKP